MIILRKCAYARAGLLGNPSDGYHGRTISVIVRNFHAEVVLYEWDSLDIMLSANDRAHFRSIHDLARDVELQATKVSRDLELAQDARLIFGHILIMPVVAGVCFELLRLGGKYRKNILLRMLIKRRLSCLRPPVECRLHIVAFLSVTNSSADVA